MLLKNKLRAPTGLETATKLDRPPLSNLKRLTLIHAPAGYGKTTFAWQLLQSQPGAKRWLSVDTLDNDPNRFWTHFLSAFQAPFRQASEDAISLLAGLAQFGIEDILDSFFSEFSCDEDGMTLVLDDFHHITNPSLIQALNYFIEYAPSNIHIIVTARSRPEFRLETRILNGQAQEFGADYLAFTCQDISNLFLQMRGVTLNDSQIEMVKRRSEGWISAIKLMFFTAQGKCSDSNVKGASIHLYQYLLEEVVNKLPHELAEFIQVAVLFERINPDMLDFVRNKVDSFFLISQLITKNLFIYRLDGESEWFRFHDLFKSCVSRTSLFSLAQQKEIVRQGASWLEQADEIFDALDCYCRNADWHDVSRILEQSGRRWLREGHSETLNFYLSSLPSSFILESPVLICMQVWGMPDREKHTQGAELLQRALDLQKSFGQQNHALLCDIYTLKAIIERLKLNWSETLSATTLALHHADKGNIDLRWRSYTTLGAYEYIRGNLQDAKLHLQNAVKYAALEKHRYGLAHSAGYLVEVLYQLGDIQAALQMATQVIRELENTPFGKLRLGAWRFAALPDLLREQGKYDQAYDTLNALCDVFKSESAEVLPKLYTMLRQWSLMVSMGRFSDALSILDAIESMELMMRFSSPFASGTVQGMRARVKLLENDMEYVLTWRNQQVFDIEKLSFYQYPDLLVYISITIANAEYGLAKELISDALNSVRKKNWKLAEAKLLLLRSAAAFKSGQKNAAKDDIELCKKILPGYQQIFFDEAPWLKAYFSWASEFFSSCATPLAEHTNEMAAINAPCDDVLSKREQQLLECVFEGMSDKEIGAALFIATGTVKTHLRNIFRKLGAKNRAHALAIYNIRSLQH